VKNNGLFSRHIYFWAFVHKSNFGK
jgi:hypothetical protein